ncbi:MAG: nucleotidyl transferase AbiEii/AbiGii toxin family protein [Candidatus Bathyarchaeota archaeon]|nr:nucleotidyl transferase AbiEii/AbiGii toxin family protein [Candidatus Bathyarchaeota archaeon]
MKKLSDAELEVKSLQDLQTIIIKAKKWKIKLAVIGGYAVQAHTKAYRLTKDIDLVITREALWKFEGLLRESGYTLRETEFGIAGSKPFNEGFIDIHVSVGKIFDMSSSITYPVSQELFTNAKELKITGYYEASKQLACSAPVIDLETLLLLKLIPTGRGKDTVDILALLLDKREEIQLANLVSKIKENIALRRHLISQLRSYAEFVRKGEAAKLWFNITGSRIPATERREILKFIRKMVDALR